MLYSAPTPFLNSLYQFEVEFTFGRDLMDGDLDDMIAITSQWAQNIEHALKDLEVQMRDSDRTKAQGLQAARQLSNEVSFCVERRGFSKEYVGCVMGARYLRDGDVGPGHSISLDVSRLQKIEIVKAKAKDEAEKLDKASGAAATAAATSGGRQRGNR